MDEDASADVPINFLNALERAMIELRPHRFIHLRERKAERSESNSEKLMRITAGAHEELFRTNTVFPFTLFPSSIVVDREKLTIANRLFFRVAKIISVPIDDILSVEADVGPFFGTVKINSRYFVANPQEVKYLWRSDAINLQRLLQGYIITREKHIDSTKIELSQLYALLYDLGQGVSD